MMKTPSKTLHTLNQSFWNKLDIQQLDMGCKTMRAKHRAFLEEESGSKISYLPLPVLFPKNTYLDMIQGAKQILEAQEILFGVFLQTLGKTNVLRMFGLPSSLAHVIEWDRKLPWADLVRFDFLMSKGQKPMICEINVDSAIGCAEAYEYIKIFHDEGILPNRYQTCFERSRSPYEDLATWLVQRSEQEKKKRIVLLDWSSWDTQGFWSNQVRQRYVEKVAQTKEVCLRNEISYLKELEQGIAGNNDLVHRIFLYDDMQKDHRFFRRIFDSGASVCMGFESEIFSEKRWCALLHQKAWQTFLSKEHILAIEQYLPHSFLLAPCNIASTLANKDRYIFKPTKGYGGRGIILGKEHSTTQLKEFLEHLPLSEWLVQEMVIGSQACLPLTNSSKPYDLVFALYCIGQSYSGLMVRGNQNNPVVNVSNGGSVGWCFLADPEITMPNETKVHV